MNDADWADVAANSGTPDNDELICDKWETRFSSVTGPEGHGADVIAIWPNKTAKLPSIVLGADVK
jgi:hypothetical protein